MTHSIFIKITVHCSDKLGNLYLSYSLYLSTVTIWKIKQSGIKSLATCNLITSLFKSIRHESAFPQNIY